MGSVIVILGGGGSDSVLCPEFCDWPVPADDASFGSECDCISGNCNDLRGCTGIGD